MFLNGLEYVQKSDEFVSVEAAFSDYVNGKYNFKVKIENRSKDIILVNPAVFYYVNADSEQDNSTGSLPGETDNEKTHYFAKNPESEIDRIKVDMQREKESHETSEAADMAFCLLGTAAGTTAAVATKDTKPLNDSLELSDEIMDNMEKEDRRHEKQMYKYESEKAKWEQKALRKTSLKPGDSIQGEVYFPADSAVKKPMFVFPFEKSTISIEFIRHQIQNSYDTEIQD